MMINWNAKKIKKNNLVKKKNFGKKRWVISNWVNRDVSDFLVLKKRGNSD